MLHITGQQCRSCGRAFDGPSEDCCPRCNRVLFPRKTMPSVTSPMGFADALAWLMYGTPITREAWPRENGERRRLMLFPRSGIPKTSESGIFWIDENEWPISAWEPTDEDVLARDWHTTEQFC